MAVANQKSSEASFSKEGDTIKIRGLWRLSSVQFLDLSSLKDAKVKALIIDASGVEAIDTGSAALLLSELSTQNIKLTGFSPSVQKIFELVLHAKGEEAELAEKPFPFLKRVGKGTLEGWESLKILLNFIGETVVSELRLFVRPKLLRIKEFTVQLEQCSLNAVPVVALVMFLIGIVIAYLFASQIEKYGANIFIVDGVSISICRELSPVIVAIIVAGRSGSAFTAHLGTMKLNEEIDALTTMGLSAMRVLILPRVLALMVALPILVAVGDVIGILGGMLIAKYRLGIETQTFIQRLHDVLLVKHVYVGLFKAPVFAAFIAIIGCKMGLTVENNARSIGLHTTATVVQGIVSVILLNAGFAVMLVELGI